MFRGDRYETFEGAVVDVDGWTLHGYEAAIATGLLGKYDRVELIDGTLYDRVAAGPMHAFLSRRVYELALGLAAADYTVGTYFPVALPPNSRPEPDLAIARGSATNYSARFPVAEDVLLVVEIGDETIARDRDVKRRLYARHGIPEYWIVDVGAEVLCRFTKPGRPCAYGKEETFAKTDTLLHELLGEVAVGELFG